MGSGIHLNNFMGAPQLSLKEAIEKYAQEHDIQFSIKLDAHMMAFKFMALELLVSI